MTDLDAAIQQAVAEALTQRRDGEELMVAALLAVLGRHRRSDRGNCAECIGFGGMQADPCPTKIDIVRELGIKVPQ